MSMRIFAITIFSILLLGQNSLFAVHTILLKKGKTVKGIVTNQNVDHVEIDTQDGKHLVIPKKSVLKVMYKDLAEADEVKIRKEEEEKREKEKERVLAAKREEILKKRQSMEDLENAKTSNTQSTQTVETSIRNSFILGSLDAKAPMSLATLNSKCQPFAEYPEYFYLFGAFRFKEPNWTELLPKEPRPLRIKQASSYTDLAITLLGGFLVTVTRKTIYVEVCEGSGFRLLSEDSIKQLKEEAVEEIKVQQELKDVEEQYELELLEKDLEKIQKKK